MTVLETIYLRRAVRDYTETTVPEATIRGLIDAAIQAPSAMNVQPWAFVVVQDRDLLSEISARSVELLRQRSLPEELRRLIDEPGWNMFYNAGALIVVYARPEGEHPDWDCCLAAENLMLAAREAGLGTCVIGLALPALSDADVKSKLSVPAEYRPVMPIIMGQPREFPHAPDRKPAEVLSWKVPLPA